MDFFAVNLVSAIAGVLDTVLTLYFWVIIVSAVLSWVNPDPYNPIVRIINSLTEPVFYRVRRWLPFTYTTGIDFSPIVVLLAIQFTKSFLVNSLYQLAMRMG